MNEHHRPSDDGWFSDDTATFGDRVAGAREATGFSQTDLARKLGIKLKTVQAWENDLSEPRANKLQMLSGMLNVSLMWLLNGEGDGVAPPGDGAGLPAEMDDLLAEIRRIKAQLGEAADRLAAVEQALRRSLRGVA